MRVLVAEDDRDIREFVEMTLSDDHDLLLAADGDEALAVIREQRFDAAVLDVMMPGVDGLALVRAIRRDPQLDGIPIVLMTAKVQEDDHIAGFEAGADRYLTKPFDPQELVDALQELADTGRERRLQEREARLRQARFLRSLEHRF